MSLRDAWKGYRYILERAGCELLAALIPQLSRRSCVTLGRLAGSLAYRFDGKGRRYALQNIACALPNLVPPSDADRIAERSYQNFAITMLSLFWSQRITPENYRRFLEIEGFDSVMERSKAEGQGIVFVCAHQGNWEWSALAFSLIGGGASIVTENFKNPSLTDLFARLRSRDQHRVLPQEKSVLKMLRAVLRGEHAGLLGDLHLSPSKAAVSVRAFAYEGESLELCLTRLPAVLAKRGGGLLVPVLSHPLPDGRCRVTAQAPVDTEGLSEKELSQNLWSVFESSIVKNPELWLWAYRHFRIKPDGATRQYPSYAFRREEYETLRGEL